MGIQSFESQPSAQESPDLQLDLVDKLVNQTDSFWEEESEKLSPEGAALCMAAVHYSALSIINNIAVLSTLGASKVEIQATTDFGLLMLNRSAADWCSKKGESRQKMDETEKELSAIDEMISHMSLSPRRRPEHSDDDRSTASPVFTEIVKRSISRGGLRDETQAPKLLFISATAPSKKASEHSSKLHDDKASEYDEDKDPEKFYEDFVKRCKDPENPKNRLIKLDGGGWGDFGTLPELLGYPPIKCPQDSSEEPMVTLKDGSQVPEQLVNTTLLALNGAADKCPFAAYDLVDKCKDPTTPIFPNLLCDSNKILTQFALIDAQENAPADVCKITLNSVEGSGRSFHFVNPVAK